MSKTKVFILSLVDITAPLPFEIIPAHFLERARSDFIDLFKKYLDSSRPHAAGFYLYEHSQVREVPAMTKNHVNYVFDELPPENWKYWVISHDGSNDQIPYLQQACFLLENEIELGTQMVSLVGNIWGGITSANMTSYLSMSEEFRRVTVEITVDDLKSVGEYYSLIKNLTPEYQHISNAIKLFSDLSALPRHSDFVIIGLFTIIESLISHSPQLDFFHDSIKHQIKTKIPLLRKRFARKLNYSKYFGEKINEEKILSKLYDYRSAIVHTGNSGMTTDFSNLLKGKVETRNFLFELTKLLLITALKEPGLITDLKSC